VGSIGRAHWTSRAWEEAGNGLDGSWERRGRLRTGWRPTSVRSVGEGIHAGISQGYDRTAGGYDDAARHNREGSIRLIASLPPEHVDRILDVGCGTGWASLEAAARFGARRISGVDVSAEMIARFREKVAGREDLEVDLHVADVLDMPVAEGGYDLVLCAMVMHWLPDRAAAVAAMARAARPGGLVAVLAPGPRHDAEFVEVLEGLDPPVPPEIPGAWAIADVWPRTLRDHMEEAGLEVLDVWVERRVRVVPPDAFMARIAAVGSHVWRETLGEEGAADLLERASAALRAASGPEGWRYTFAKTFAIARRPEP
jgi:SAM-dependent methyltransferase